MLMVKSRRDRTRYSSGAVIHFGKKGNWYVLPTDSVVDTTHVCNEHPRPGHDNSNQRWRACAIRNKFESQTQGSEEWLAQEELGSGSGKLSFNIRVRFHTALTCSDTEYPAI
jgi:hypothetical protein